MKPDARDTVPLSAACHTDGHRRGWVTWQAEHGLNLGAMAEALAEQSPAYAAADPAAKKLLAELV